jgi:transcriptional regulator with XRE-family HTH domain
MLQFNTGFARILRNYRKNAGMTQQQLSDRTLTSRNAIVRMEAGVNEPTWEFVFLAKFILDIPPQELFGPVPVTIANLQR